MRVPALFLPVLLYVLVLLGGGRVAYAATPTPPTTPMSGPTTPATSIPSPQQSSWFQGAAWINGHVSQQVIAKIGDVECSEPMPALMPTDSNMPHYVLRALNEQQRAGCGYEGATIAFFVEGQQAAQTAIWHAGGNERLNLIAGPSFARFGGGLSLQREPLTQFVEPFIGNQLCGHDMTLGLLGSSTIYDTVVYSAEQQAGCGAEGSEITFKLVDAQGNVIATANEKGVWHAWDGVASPQQLNLTFGSTTGIKPGNVGDGASQRGDNDWRALPAALLAFGLIGLGAGVALRRRATA